MTITAEMKNHFPEFGATISITWAFKNSKELSHKFEGWPKFSEHQTFIFIWPTKEISTKTRFFRIQEFHCNPSAVSVFYYTRKQTHRKYGWHENYCHVPREIYTELASFISDVSCRRAPATPLHESLNSRDDTTAERVNILLFIPTFKSDFVVETLPPFCFVKLLFGDLA